MLVKKVEQALRLAEKDEFNAFIELYPEAVEKAEEVEKKIEQGEGGKLAGLVISVKNNIAVKGKKLTCASKMLEHYTAPYDATVIAKLRKEDAIIIGSNNMDEFACGSDGTTSAFGPTKNPINPSLVPGGSSSGCAAAVSAGIVDCAIGSDTGGSIRCPSAFCGVWGFKPSYGAVSRYGLGDMAMSLDQIGPIARSLEVVENVFSVIAGEDEKDQCTHNFRIEEKKEVKRVAVPKEALKAEDEVVKGLELARERLELEGIATEEVEIKEMRYLIPIYYLTVFAEFASAMQRYDGLRYGKVGEMEDYALDSAKIRAKCLGQEVKRRIMLGTFITSKEQKNAWFRRAQVARKALKKRFDALFQTYDALLLPTMPTLPWKIGEKSQDPLSMYLSDVFTVLANLIFAPAVNIPIMGKKPIGIQIIGQRGHDLTVLSLARKVVEK